ncbi:hypothetical protein ACIQAD_27640 [Streptomyces sp. NPDC088551]|uniref:hypothetical protein n=1 Tax=unclassified Streptomyces TaxID=2593676 RepID=UPI0034431E1F
MTGKPPFDPVREFAVVERRCGALQTAIEKALAEQQPLHTRLLLTDLQKLDDAAFYESVFGCPPPKKGREE